MRDPSETTIGGVTYVYTPLPAMRSLTLASRVTRLISGAAGGMKSATAALAATSDEDLQTVAKVFAEATRVTLEGKRPKLSDIFDVHFAGRFGAMMAWLSWCLRVEYVDPLAETLGSESPAPDASAEKA